MCLVFFGKGHDSVIWTFAQGCFSCRFVQGKRRWMLEDSEFEWRHRVHGVTNSIIQRAQFGLTGFQVGVFKV